MALDLARVRATTLRQRLIAAAVIVLLIIGAFWFTSGPKTRTVSAHFSQAISVYAGSSVDIMGITVGQVTAIVPEGATVRVDMTYDAKYHLPADVSASIVAPTLVADRFVQLTAAKGENWCWTCDSSSSVADSGDIPASRSHQPLEIDDVYKSLSQLSKTLGPSEANKTGALSELLNASAKALKGNGVLGNDMLRNLSGAVRVLGDNSPQLFSTVDGLSSLSTTLRNNDALVSTFLTRLAGVSTELGGESQNLQQALAAIADALGTVQSFVHDNRAALKGDIQQLTTTVKALGDQRKTLGQILQLAPLGLNNLTEAYDSVTGTEGIRLQLGPEGTDVGNLLCGVITSAGMPNPGTACDLLRALLPGGTNHGVNPSSTTSKSFPQAPSAGLAGILDPALKGLLG
ncbi:ABC transporter substrate-binding protein [Nocardioides baekrokdamisoli]|uniref:ABC transporter substrate-binding protein n=1 Tax=Nocardioides baekrokdamisoli TaxID=1804624 RepID=A0A3G9IHA5_9ACTN|nr:MCE family protein [Nocardioides baekrokdamisoli]BBH18407.1 ABC transporter substrate-binding protein [Nocardioides baekrokdamisoli]